MTRDSSVPHVTMLRLLSRIPIRCGEIQAKPVTIFLNLNFGNNYTCDCLHGIKIYKGLQLNLIDDGCFLSNITWPITLRQDMHSSRRFTLQRSRNFEVTWDLLYIRRKNYLQYLPKNIVVIVNHYQMCSVLKYSVHRWWTILDKTLNRRMLINIVLAIVSTKFKNNFAVFLKSSTLKTFLVL